METLFPLIYRLLKILNTSRLACMIFFKPRHGRENAYFHKIQTVSVSASFLFNRFTIFDFHIVSRLTIKLYSFKIMFVCAGNWILIENNTKHTRTIRFMVSPFMLFHYCLAAHILPFFYLRSTFFTSIINILWQFSFCSRKRFRSVFIFAFFPNDNDDAIKGKR